jgi:hypothetical protein
MRNVDAFLLTAGGRITCLRCTAQSSRTKKQCGKPALKTSRTQKCGHHGGGNVGPKTPEGKARSAAAHLKTGAFTKAAIKARSHKLAELYQLEDACIILGLSSAPKTTGRKPLGYEPSTTLGDIWRFAFDKESNKQ